MKKDKKQLARNIFSVSEYNILESGNAIKNKMLTESDSGELDADAFENNLIDVYATTIAINQMIADRTLKTIACSVPITNTVASIDSVNIYDPDGRLNLLSNSTFSGQYGVKEREDIPELVVKKEYQKGELFKFENVVYEAVVEGAVIPDEAPRAIARAFYSGMIRYCSEAKSGDTRTFRDAGEVDIKNINFRSHVKNRTAFMSITPEALMDRLLAPDAMLDAIDVGIETSNGEFKSLKVNRILLSLAQYIANEKNKDIIHTAMCVAKKDEYLDLLSLTSPSYEVGRLLYYHIQDTISDVNRRTKQIANYVVVSEKISNYLSISGLATKHTSYTYSDEYCRTDSSVIEPDHIHSNLYIGNAIVVVDMSADFDYYMVGVNNPDCSVSGIYVSDQNFILPINEFGVSVDTDSFINFGNTKLLTATSTDNFSTRIMALTKYALTIYPHSDLLKEDDPRVQFTDNISDFANKSELIRFVGVDLPEIQYAKSEGSDKFD